jgi:hypothetical protein
MDIVHRNNSQPPIISECFIRSDDEHIYQLLNFILTNHFGGVPSMANADNQKAIVIFLSLFAVDPVSVC